MAATRRLGWREITDITIGACVYSLISWRPLGAGGFLPPPPDWRRARASSPACQRGCRRDPEDRGCEQGRRGGVLGESGRQTGSWTAWDVAQRVGARERVARAVFLFARVGPPAGSVAGPRGGGLGYLWEFDFYPFILSFPAPKQSDGAADEPNA